MYTRGLVGATEGNISCRLGDDRILCTPSGLCKGLLKLHELVVIDLDGKVVAADNGRMGFRGDSQDISQSDHLSRKPSSEILMHLGLYQEKPEAQAIVHAHPLYATGFAYAGAEFPVASSPEGYAVLGDVASVPFATPGTQDVPDGIKPFAAIHKTFLLQNHGATVTGDSLMDALFRMETLERLAKVLVVARQLGGEKLLPK
jgi:L-fuculose-phosphate aldolase